MGFEMMYTIFEDYTAWHCLALCVCGGGPVGELRLVLLFVVTRIARTETMVRPDWTYKTYLYNGGRVCSSPSWPSFISQSSNYVFIHSSCPGHILGVAF